MASTWLGHEGDHAEGDQLTLSLSEMITFGLSSSKLSRVERSQKVIISEDDEGELITFAAIPVRGG
jgi:hypothetical protein